MHGFAHLHVLLLLHISGIEILDLHLVDRSIDKGYTPAVLYAEPMMFLPRRSIAVLTHPCKPCTGTMLGG